MSKINLVSNDSCELKRLKNVVHISRELLTEPILYECYSVQSFKELSEKVNLLVYDSPSVSAQFLRTIILNWRSHNSQTAIIVLSNLVNEEFCKRLDFVNNLALISRLAKSHDISTAINNLLTIEIQNRRRFKRYLSEQEVTLKGFRSGHERQSYIKDISYGGLRVANSEDGLASEDIFTVDVNLSKMGRVHNLYTKKTWSRDSEMGLKFISENEAMDHVFNKCG